MVPYHKDASGRGVPEVDPAGYTDGFGVVRDGDLDAALGEARELLRLVEDLGVRFVCTSAGSPYYNPHLQRPALFPPSDGYLPPEDPLVGVARQIEATARLKAACPGLVFVGSAYSYLQEWLPNVGQRVLRDGGADFVGLGRMVLSYPELRARRARRAPARPEAHLPHLQRLHHGAAQGTAVGLLPARPLLPETAGGRVAEGDQAGAPGVSGAPAADARSRHQTLAVATSFLALFSIVGIALYGLPFFYDFFVRDLGWSRQQVTSGNALSKLIVGPLFGFFAGMAIDRFGPRRLMLVGILVAGLALVGLGSTATLLAFYSFYLMNALGNVLGGPLPNQVLLSGWFEGGTGGGRGKAMGVAYLGIGIGGMLVPQLAHALEAAFGWRAALAILGALMVLVAFPAAFFVRDARGSVPAAGGPHGAPPVDAGSIGAVLRSPAFYLIAIGSMASIGAVGGTMQNLKLYLTGDRGLGQADAANVASLVLFGSLAGRLLMGWLADRWAKKRVMLLIYAIVALSVPLLAAAPSHGSLLLAALVFGLGLGGEYMIIPLMAAELFGLRLMGRVMGIVVTADGVAEAVVPLAVATIRDRAGSYGAGFALLVGLAVVGAAAVSLLPSARGPAAEGFTTPPGV